jgi:hypothetical protein
MTQSLMNANGSSGTGAFGKFDYKTRAADARLLPKVSEAWPTYRYVSAPATSEHRDDTLMCIGRDGFVSELPSRSCTLEGSQDVVQTFRMGVKCSRPHKSQRYGTSRLQRRRARRVRFER